MSRTLLTNARVIDPASGFDDRAQVLIEGETILDLGTELFAGSPPEGVEVIDVRGKAVIPGLVDMRVFVGEPGLEHNETLRTASEAAAAGGVTTMAIMPNTDPVIDEAALVDYLMRRARDTAIVRVAPMAALTQGLRGEAMTEMGLLADAGAVAFTDGGSSITNALLMRRLLSYARTFGFLICHDALEPGLGDGVMAEGELSTRLGLPGVPAEAESIMVERDMALVGLTGGRYHLSQLSVPGSLGPLRRARERGLDVTCAASIHHLALNEVDIGAYKTFCKVKPPLRPEEDRALLVEALAKGEIDVVVSSHDPQAPENKRLPFEEAAFGAVGLETLLPLLLELHHKGDVDLITALKAVTVKPAQLLGLPTGRIAKGAPADLAIVDLGAPWVLEADKLRSRSKNTPYDRRKMQGKVLRTIVGGRTVFLSD